jgi:hypothetical protein
MLDIIYLILEKLHVYHVHLVDTAIIIIVLSMVLTYHALRELTMVFKDSQGTRS